MEIISQILEDRIINNEKKFEFYQTKYNLNKEEFNTKFRYLNKIKINYSDQIIIKALKLFNSKVKFDKDIFNWNEKNKSSKKKKKEFSFIQYSKININGKSIKSEEQFSKFYFDILELYKKQIKLILSDQLSWIIDVTIIKDCDLVCYYCGINEQILSELYNDQEYTCKTKRNRGAWFELDRSDSSIHNNVYSKENMVLCCYFCNNHKSDVLSSKEMRQYFGEPMFLFLIDKYKSITKTK
jgi:hypothetical protein